MAANASTRRSVYLQDGNEVEKVFKRFDANGDGMISAAELLHALKALGSDTSPDEVSRMMAEIDADKDGFINLREFADFCGRDAPQNDGGAQELLEAFELYDQDHNGLISSEELHQILNRLGERCTVEDCIRMIQSVDSDGDGFVSFDEFKKMMTNNKTGDVQSNGV